MKRKTDADRLAAFTAAQIKSRANFTSVSIRKDTHAALIAYCDRLEAENGYRPNLSQTLTILLKRAGGL